MHVRQQGGRAQPRYCGLKPSLYNLQAIISVGFKVNNDRAVRFRKWAELIVERADSRKEHMGLTAWENAPDGKIIKADASSYVAHI